MKRRSTSSRWNHSIRRPWEECGTRFWRRVVRRKSLEMWQFVVEVARRLNVQVFATTHSYDCIRGLGSLVQSRPELMDHVSIQKVGTSLKQKVENRRLPMTRIKTHLGQLLRAELNARDMSANQLALAIRVPANRITAILRRAVDHRRHGRSPRALLRYRGGLLDESPEPVRHIAGRSHQGRCHRPRARRRIGSLIGIRHGAAPRTGNGWV